MSGVGRRRRRSPEVGVERAAGERALGEVRTRLLVGAPADGLDGLPPRAARAVGLAVRVGGPAVPALDAALASLDDTRRAERAVAVAAAQARTVAAALAALPAIGLAWTGWLLDEPLWRFYLTPAGSGVAAAAGALLAAGLLAVRILVRRAVPSRPAAAPAAPDEIADLLATALAAGLPPGEALRSVGAALPDHASGHSGDLARTALALELGYPVALPSGLDRVVDVVRTTSRWGAPAAPPLRRLAADLRAAELARALVAAERLPALLTFPTTLCLLPASVLLVGAPLVASGLAAVAAGT